MEDNYYLDQLNQINNTSENQCNVKITCSDGSSTKYLGLNKISAKILRDWLNEKFDIK